LPARPGAHLPKPPRELLPLEPQRRRHPPKLLLRRSITPRNITTRRRPLRARPLRLRKAAPAAPSKHLFATGHGGGLCAAGPRRSRAGRSGITRPAFFGLGP